MQTINPTCSGAHFAEPFYSLSLSSCLFMKDKSNPYEIPPVKSCANNRLHTVRHTTQQQPKPICHFSLVLKIPCLSLARSLLFPQLQLFCLLIRALINSLYTIILKPHTSSSFVSSPFSYSHTHTLQQLQPLLCLPSCLQEAPQNTPKFSAISIPFELQPKKFASFTATAVFSGKKPSN